MEEIERKFILHKIPDFIDSLPIPYERYFLYTSEQVEIRVQSKGGVYEFERKKKNSNLSRSVYKIEITKEEFEYFKSVSKGSIIRESYLIPNLTKGTIKVYKGNLQGLIRAEIEFESSDEAQKFIPLTWFGKEITNSPLSKDKDLIKLESSEFNNLLKEYLND